MNERYHRLSKLEREALAKGSDAIRNPPRPYVRKRDQKHDPYRALLRYGG